MVCGAALGMDENARKVHWGQVSTPVYYRTRACFNTKKPAAL